MKKQNIMETGGSGSNCRCHGNEYRTGDTVQAAGGKTLAVSSQKAAESGIKNRKGKNAVITVKAGKNVKITIPKGTYKVTIRVVGKKAAVVK